MKEIIIENTRGIKKLRFRLPEHSGVYLIVGTNGAGKTTLLTCLDRICNSMAFAQGFDTSRLTREIDQYRNSSITYTVDNTSIRFRKCTARWVSTPKAESRDLLQQFGFSSSLFIHADSKRIAINQAAIRDGDFVQASRPIKDTLNRLFETEKYTRLERLRNRNGRGRQATYFYIMRDEDGSIYSEKRFSTGELALLHLADSLQNIENGSMVLLDEAEMALHPRIQVNLVHYLKQTASEKNLTVFISTHSPTIIKSVSKNQIIMLEESETSDEVLAKTPCYAARAIGCVDFEASTIPDYIFFVEDERAKTIVKHMLNRYYSLNPSQATASVSVVPVGGYLETARLAVRTKHQLFSQSKVFAIVDQDAFEGTGNNPTFQQLYSENLDCIFGLGFTPEVFLIEQIEGANRLLKDAIRRKFHIELSQIIQDDEYRTRNSQNPLKLAKDRYSVVLNRLSSASGESAEITNNELIRIIVEHVPDSVVMQLLGRVIGH